MSQTCRYCYRIVARACQSDTETLDCPKLKRVPASPANSFATPGKQRIRRQKARR